MRFTLIPVPPPQSKPGRAISICETLRKHREGSISTCENFSLSLSLCQSKFRHEIKQLKREVGNELVSFSVSSFASVSVLIVCLPVSVSLFPPPPHSPFPPSLSLSDCFFLALSPPPLPPTSLTPSQLCALVSVPFLQHSLSLAELFPYVRYWGVAI